MFGLTQGPTDDGQSGGVTEGIQKVAAEKAGERPEVPDHRDSGGSGGAPEADPGQARPQVHDHRSTGNGGAVAPDSGEARPAVSDHRNPRGFGRVIKEVAAERAQKHAKPSKPPAQVPLAPTGEWPPTQPPENLPRPAAPPEPELSPPGLTPPADFAAGRTADFLMRVQGFTTEQIRVVAFDGREGLSELFEFRIEVVSFLDDLDPDRMIGLSATLEIQGERGVRQIHGIVRRFERLDEGHKFAHYEMLVVPPHWMLTQRIQSRIFQQPRHADTTVLGIVREVIKTAGMPEKALTSMLAPNAEYKAREFTVQYRESDWDFISRLLEEEGIQYFFEHDQDGCRMVLADNAGAHAPLSVDGGEGDALRYVDPNGLVPEEEFVYRVRVASQMRIGSVTLDDFDFGDPGGELRVNARDQRFTGLQAVDYPGVYRDKQLGQRLADIRLQEQRAQQRVTRMSATVRTLAPGRTFELTEHAAASGKFLITALSHRALQPQSAEAEAGDGPGTRYEADMTAIPADTPFRPARVTPRPTVLGSQTAIVVGPAGEEIHTDAYGRVKVRFHWDQEAEFDEKASCFVRVSQGWAGGQYGMLFLPRVGQEVIVDFLEGDPDRPIITGRVYNKDHMPPYKLPDNKSISTIRTCSTPGAGGGNEIRFDDAKKNEQLLLFGQNALHLRSNGNRYESVGWHAHRTVHKDSFELVKENSHSIVTLDRFEQTKGNEHHRVMGDVKEMVSGKQTSFVVKKYALLNSEGIVLESDTSISLKVKGNFIRIDASGITIVGKTVKINSGGAADTWEADFPELPKEALAAATTESGRNFKYRVKPIEGQALDPYVNGQGSERDPAETQTSWIEVELVDDLGRPAPNEEYVVTEPDGREHRGRLNAKGLARVAVNNPGACRISFPKLDAAVWDREGGTA